jgi:hypothetical protein
VHPQQILLALTAGDSAALGNIWRITAKKTDFYLDFVGELGSGIHLSMHGPSHYFEGHRFHVKADREAVTAAREQGHLAEHAVPRAGFAFNGVQLEEKAFLVARIRWSWNLQRPRYRSAALSGNAPELAENQSGRVMSKELRPNSAWDIDLVVSYDEPFWPQPTQSSIDGSRLGPLRNDSGLWLTATSYHRWQPDAPTPEDLSVAPPRALEEPNRITCCGPGPDGADDLYRFAESITSRKSLKVLADIRRSSNR